MNYDEWNQLKLARYTTASEAFLKLWGHEIVKKSTVVDTLYVHLPRASEIIYEAGTEENVAKNELNRQLRGEERPTKLTEFFRVCKIDKFDITYEQVYEKYKWNERQKTWKYWKRPKRKLVRVGAASAGNLELQVNLDYF